MIVWFLSWWWKKLISKDFLRNSNQRYNKIAELLLEASNRYRIEFNDYKLQKKSSDIATCGRHVISRIILKNLDIIEYHEFLSIFKWYGLKPMTLLQLLVYLISDKVSNTISLSCSSIQSIIPLIVIYFNSNLLSWL